MLVTLLLAFAALMEVAGDALIRSGMRSGRIVGFVAGAFVLFGYGVLVNAPRWDFGRLLGVYISAFFVIAQVVAYFACDERPTSPILTGGALIVGGGLVITFWRPS